MLDHRGSGIFLEGSHAQVAVVVFDALGLNALHLDDFTRQRDFQRLGLALAQDRQLDLGFRLAAHALHRIRQGQPFDQGIVEFEDEITGFDPGPVRRGILDRRNDLDQTVFHADLNAQSAEFALRTDLQVLVSVGIKIG